MSEKFDRNQTEAKINIRAWKDPAFRERLKADPRSALKEIGMTKVPKALDIQVAEEGKNQWVIRLYTCPLNLKEMSQEALEQRAAGEAQEAKCCPKSPT